MCLDVHKEKRHWLGRDTEANCGRHEKKENRTAWNLADLSEISWQGMEMSQRVDTEPSLEVSSEGKKSIREVS